MRKLLDKRSPKRPSGTGDAADSPPRSATTPAAIFTRRSTLDGRRTPDQVLCEMVGAVDARNLGEHVGHLNHDELRSVEDGLSLVVDIAWATSSD